MHETLKAVLRLAFEFSTSEWIIGGAYCTVANDSQQVIGYDKVRTQRSRVKCLLPMNYLLS